MNWNNWVRQIHRWLSIAFTVAVIVNIVAMGQGSNLPSGWASWRCSRSSCSCSPVCTCSCCRMPPGGAAGDAPADRRDGNGRQDVQETGEGRKEGRRQAGGCEAGPPLRRQPADREGLRRRPRAGLHRGHAGLEKRRRAPPRRAHRAHRSRACTRRSNGTRRFYGSRGPGLVPRHPCASRSTSK